jgi:hypothetical protein
MKPTDGSETERYMDSKNVLSERASERLFIYCSFPIWFPFEMIPRNVRHRDALSPEEWGDDCRMHYGMYLVRDPSVMIPIQFNTSLASLGKTVFYSHVWK